MHADVGGPVPVVVQLTRSHARALDLSAGDVVWLQVLEDPVQQAERPPERGSVAVRT